MSKLIETLVATVVLAMAIAELDEAHSITDFSKLEIFGACYAVASILLGVSALGMGIFRLIKAPSDRRLRD